MPGSAPSRAGKPSDAGDDDQQRADLGRTDLQDAAGDSPAAGRRAARRWPRRPAGRRDRKGECCSRAGAGPVRTLPSSSRIHRPAGSPWVTCTQNDDVGAGAADDGRRQRAGPVVAVVCGQCGCALVLGGGGHAEGVEHGDQRCVGDVDVPAGPVLVFGCHAVAAGQLDERGGQSQTSCRPSCLACSALSSAISRHRGSTSHPRCPVAPPAGHSRRGRTQPGPGGRRCTGWTSCSSRRR